MTDEADRTRARIADASGELADRARVLADELRRGARSLGELQLLAYLADPAACLALGEASPELPPDDRDAAVLWLRGFAAWGEEVLGRAVVAWLWGWHDLEAPGSAFSEVVEGWWHGRVASTELEPAARAHSERWLAGSVQSPGNPYGVTRAVEAWERGDRRSLLGSSERELYCTPRHFPVPALIAPRVVPWVAGRLLPAVGGEGQLIQRALDAGTPPARRLLVDYLRTHRTAPVLYGRDRHLVDLHVDGVGFEDVGGFIHGSPKLSIRLDLLAIPPGEGASPGAR